MIDNPAALSIGVSLVIGLVFLMVLRNQKIRLRRIRQEFEEMECEEKRMFHFLHDLGIAIGKEPSNAALSRMIVEGVLEVVGAHGGAIYYVSSDSDFLVPEYVSKFCPPLAEVPEDVLEKAKTDSRALASHLRLARVMKNDGIFGSTNLLGEAIHIGGFKNHKSASMNAEEVSVMISPLRYAGLEIGMLAVAKRYEDGKFSENDFAVFKSIAEQSSFAIGNARVHRDANEKKMIEGELHNAREVQRVLLPQDDPQVAGFRVNGTNIPARIISGDYYDYISLCDGCLGVVVADVSGKGVPAGLLMAMCRSLLRAVSLTNASPSLVLSAVNRYLFPDIREDMFISMIYGVLDPATGQLTFTRAGHDPALVYRKATGEVEVLRPKGIALGIDPGDVFERVTKDQVVDLESGDCVLFYTDGVNEALNHNEEEFGMKRLGEVFKAAAGMGAEAVVKQVQDAVEDFVDGGPQMDDVTIVAIEKR